MSESNEPRNVANFHFLYWRREGVISRQDWWRAVLPIFIITASAQAVWMALAHILTPQHAKTPWLQDPKGFIYCCAVAYAILYFFLSFFYFNLSYKRLKGIKIWTGFAGILPVFNIIFFSIWFVSWRHQNTLIYFYSFVIGILFVVFFLWNMIVLGTIKNHKHHR